MDKILSNLEKDIKYQKSCIKESKILGTVGNDYDVGYEKGYLDALRYMQDVLTKYTKNKK